MDKQSLCEEFWVTTEELDEIHKDFENTCFNKSCKHKDIPWCCSIFKNKIRELIKK